MLISARNPYIHAEPECISAPGFVHWLRDGSQYGIKLEQGASGNWNVWVREIENSSVSQGMSKVYFSGQIVARDREHGEEIVSKLLTLENYHAL